MSEEGDRYEYEMNFLSDAALTVKLRFVPIQTVYNDKNSNSHFRPVADSIRVYGRFLRFAAASLIGAAADYLLFWLFSRILPLPQTLMIFSATALARIGSGFVNYLLNRCFSFNSKKPIGGEMLRYGILFLCQMAASAGLVAFISKIPIPVIVIKMIVDTCLFFISYTIQKNWVFRKGADK